MVTVEDRTNNYNPQITSDGRQVNSNELFTVMNGRAAMCTFEGSVERVQFF